MKKAKFLDTYHPPIPNANMPIYISAAGITKKIPLYHTKPALRQDEHINYCRFEYVLSGKGYIEIGNDVTDIAAGDFFFINKGIPGILYSDDEYPMEKIYVYAGGDLVEGLVSAYNMDEPLIVCRLDASENLYTILQTLKKSKSYTHQIFDEVGDELLKIIRKVYCNKAESDSRPNNKIIARNIMSYIEWNFVSKFTIEDMEKALALGKTQLIKHFKDYYGTTPMKYLQDKRLEVSKHYLKHTDVPISSIPGIVGFSNISYFSFVFKESTGVSPREYRKLHKKQL